MKYMNKSIEELHELLKEGKVTERKLIDESLELSKKVSMLSVTAIYLTFCSGKYFSIKWYSIWS